MYYEEFVMLWNDTQGNLLTVVCFSLQFVSLIKHTLLSYAYI